MIKSELVEKLAGENPHLFQRDIENIVNAILDEVGNVGALLMGPDGAFITGSDFLMTTDGAGVWGAAVFTVVPGGSLASRPLKRLSSAVTLASIWSITSTCWRSVVNPRTMPESRLSA